MERGQPVVESGLKQSEVSPLRGIGGLAEGEPAVEVDVMEIADVGHEPLHGDQQKEVGENTVANGGQLAEETRPGWCAAMWLAAVDGMLPTWVRSGHWERDRQWRSIQYAVVGDQSWVLSLVLLTWTPWLSQMRNQNTTILGRRE